MLGVGAFFSILFLAATCCAESTLFEKEIRNPSLHPEYWLALVPGNSEEWGHHRAPPQSEDPDGKAISAVFKYRLDLGYQLLEAGAVRFLLISGGAIDSDRPDYVEAIRGKQYLIDHYLSRFKMGKLNDRLLLDEVATTSVANIHNADQLCVEHGIHQYVVATELDPLVHPKTHQLIPPQGQFFLSSTSFPTNLRTLFMLGYGLGPFKEVSIKLSGKQNEKVLLHTIINDEKLKKGGMVR